MHFPYICWKKLLTEKCIANSKRAFKHRYVNIFFFKYVWSVLFFTEWLKFPIYQFFRTEVWWKLFTIGFHTNTYGSFFTKTWKPKAPSHVTFGAGWGIGRYFRELLESTSGYNNRYLLAGDATFGAACLLAICTWKGREVLEKRSDCFVAYGLLRRGRRHGGTTVQPR